MQQHARQTWSAPVAAAAALCVALMLAGPARAQAPAPGLSGGLMPGAPQADDERGSDIAVSAQGVAYRTWFRTGDERTGGGAIFAARFDDGAWKKVFEFKPPGAGVSVKDSSLALGPGGEVAITYRWWQWQPRLKQVRIATSQDGGKTWSVPGTPVDDSSKAFDSEVAWGRDRSLVVVWSDERRASRLFDVYARRSPDGGATWEAPVHLSRFPLNGPTDYHARPLLASDGAASFWSVWIGYRGGRSALYVNRSTDGGRTWTSPRALTGDSRSVYAHRLVHAGDRLMVVWQDTRTGKDKIYAVTSSDRGETWSAPARVDHLPEEKNAVVASQASVELAASGEAFAAWHDGRHGRDDVFFARSEDGGRTWAGPDARLDQDEPGVGVSRHAHLALAGDGRVAVVWEDDRAGHEAIYLRVRSAAGTWGPEQRLSTPTPKQGARAVRAAWGRDGILHVTWEVWDYTLGPTRPTRSVEAKAVRP